jgi:DMSO reductase anchor subunit
MHPSFSIVFFTTASGAGFALLGLLGIGAPLGLVPGNTGFAILGLAASAVLAVGGLVSSVFHLGRPERAWHAFSQWRSSWLSREGVFAVLTFPPALVFAVGWIVFGVTGGVVGLCGILAAGLAAATVYCTGMIYASLKPIRQWHNGWVVPNYLMLGAMGGLLLLDLLVRPWARPVGIEVLTLVAVAFAWWLKERYWSSVDLGAGPSSVASATGLGRRGPVRLLEPPHTQENYLLKEMGFRIARKHAARLRLIARLTAFLVPALATVAALIVDGGGFGALAAGVAVSSAALGLVIERWLFFAEAQHTVTLYYGAEAV